VFCVLRDERGEMTGERSPYQTGSETSMEYQSVVAMTNAPVRLVEPASAVAVAVRISRLFCGVQSREKCRECRTAASHWRNSSSARNSAPAGHEELCFGRSRGAWLYHGAARLSVSTLSSSSAQALADSLPWNLLPPHINTSFTLTHRSAHIAPF
jgi:hypothetical protein